MHIQFPFNMSEVFLLQREVRNGIRGSWQSSTKTWRNIILQRALCYIRLDCTKSNCLLEEEEEEEYSATK